MEDRWITVPANALSRGDGAHRVHAAHWAGAGTGRVLVCVHGLGGSHLNWSLVGPGLAALPGVKEVWAPDLAGFGLTEPGGRSAHIVDNLDLLDGFVATVSDAPVVLLGNSMGGMLALVMGARRAHRVAGLVLVDPAAPVRPSWPPDMDVLKRFGAMAIPGIGERWLARSWKRTTPEQQVAETMRLIAAAPERLDAQMLERHVEIAARRREMPHAISSSLLAARSLLRHLLLAPDRYWRNVVRVTAPTLLVHSAADRLIRDHVTQSLRNRRSDWASTSYPDLGHVPMLEDPERFLADVRSWLDDTGLLGEAQA
jgi:pimeloyl-ACP methyl ester carboxylesterase